MCLLFGILSQQVLFRRVWNLFSSFPLDYESDEQPWLCCVGFGPLSVNVKLSHSYQQRFVPLPSTSLAPFSTRYYPSHRRMCLLCNLFVAARILATFPDIEVMWRPHSDDVTTPHSYKHPRRFLWVLQIVNTEAYPSKCARCRLWVAACRLPAKSAE